MKQYFSNMLFIFAAMSWMAPLDGWSWNNSTFELFEDSELTYLEKYQLKMKTNLCPIFEALPKKLIFFDKSDSFDFRIISIFQEKHFKDFSPCFKNSYQEFKNGKILGVHPFKLASESERIPFTHPALGRDRNAFVNYENLNRNSINFREQLNRPITSFRPIEIKGLGN